MSNREQLAWCIDFGDYENSDVARIIADMLDSIGVYMDGQQQERLKKWLGLNCDNETNNWGELNDWDEEE